MSAILLDYETFYKKNAKRFRSEHQLELAEINVLCGDNARTLTTAAYKKALALIDGGFARVKRQIFKVSLLVYARVSLNPS